MRSFVVGANGDFYSKKDRSADEIITTPPAITATSRIAV